MDKIAIYEKLLTYVNSMEEDEKKMVMYYVESENKKCPLSVGSLIDVLVSLKGEIRQDAAKNSGNGSLYKTAMIILKNSKKVLSGNTGFHGAFMYEGVQYVLDGYRLLAIKNKIELPESELASDIGKKNIDACKRNCTNEYPLPDAGELNAYIKQELAKQKARGIKPNERKVFYDAGAQYPCFNAEYLLSMMQAMPGCTAKYRSVLSPVYFDGGEVEGVLCPVNKKEDVA